MHFTVEHFEGPLDLLLQLVEQEQLDISHIALAKVADQFIQYVNEHPAIPLEELADFLVVAAKLVYMKSKLLLPTLHDPSLEEGPDLESQLRAYREFVRASRDLDKIWKLEGRSFTRQRRAMIQTEVKFIPPTSITGELLRDLMLRVVARITPLLTLPTAALERVVTIQEKISQLFSCIKQAMRVTFTEFVGRSSTRPETVVSFLALLELVKQRFVVVSQQNLFHEIDIEAHPTPPEVDPFAESYI